MTTDRKELEMSDSNCCQRHGLWASYSNHLSFLASIRHLYYVLKVFARRLHKDTVIREREERRGEERREEF